jgi:hypothetical protein
MKGPSPEGPACARGRLRVGRRPLGIEIISQFGGMMGRGFAAIARRESSALPKPVSAGSWFMGGIVTSLLCIEGTSDPESFDAPMDTWHNVY